MLLSIATAKPGVQLNAQLLVAGISLSNEFPEDAHCCQLTIWMSNAFVARWLTWEIFYEILSSAGRLRIPSWVFRSHPSPGFWRWHHRPIVFWSQNWLWRLRLSWWGRCSHLHRGRLWDLVRDCPSQPTSLYQARQSRRVLVPSVTEVSMGQHIASRKLWVSVSPVAPSLLPFRV